jgi:predicted AlkP superfamily pyrophosphatase or phosphodiesterase
MKSKKFFMIISGLLLSIGVMAEPSLQHPNLVVGIVVDQMRYDYLYRYKEKIINGYNRELSGDIQIILKPQNYTHDSQRGTTHGTWNPYDTHIPLLFFGKGVKHGQTNREVYMTDIAPTIASLLHIQMPNGCIGKPMTEIFEK